MKALLFIYRLTHSASELSGFTCTSSLTMNEKFQYRTRPPSAVLKNFELVFYIFEWQKATIILFVCPSKVLHKHRVHFLLGPTMVPRVNKSNTYANFFKTNKEYYGIFESGLFLVSLV